MLLTQQGQTEALTGEKKPWQQKKKKPEEKYASTASAQQREQPGP